MTFVEYIRDHVSKSQNLQRHFAQTLESFANGYGLPDTSSLNEGLILLITQKKLALAITLIHFAQKHRSFDPNLRNPKDENKTILMYAMMYRNEELVKFLLSAGADKELLDARGKTALWYGTHPQNGAQFVRARAVKKYLQLFGKKVPESIMRKSDTSMVTSKEVGEKFEDEDKPEIKPAPKKRKIEKDADEGSDDELTLAEFVQKYLPNLNLNTPIEAEANQVIDEELDDGPQEEPDKQQEIYESEVEDLDNDLEDDDDSEDEEQQIVIQPMTALHPLTGDNAEAEGFVQYEWLSGAPASKNIVNESAPHIPQELNLMFEPEKLPGLFPEVEIPAEGHEPLSRFPQPHPPKPPEPTRFQLTFLDVVARGDMHAVRNFIRNGADINQVESTTGRTALHIAAISGYQAMVDFLLRQKINHTAMDNQGKNALGLVNSLLGTRDNRPANYHNLGNVRNKLLAYSFIHREHAPPPPSSELVAKLRFWHQSIESNPVTLSSPKNKI